jgi:hypothetical protein
VDELWIGVGLKNCVPEVLIQILIRETASAFRDFQVLGFQSGQKMRYV